MPIRGTPIAVTRRSTTASCTDLLDEPARPRPAAMSSSARSTDLACGRSTRRTTVPPRALPRATCASRRASIGHEIDQALFLTIGQLGDATTEEGRRPRCSTGRRRQRHVRPASTKEPVRPWENVVGAAGVRGEISSRCRRRCFRTRSTRMRLSAALDRASNKVEALADPYRCRRGDSTIFMNVDDALRPRGRAPLRGRLRVEDLPEAWRARM